jgi:transcriptional regulator with XRE-family HTH domain
MESPLVQWRKSLGLTQQELAILTGISSSTISKVENGVWPLGEALLDFLRDVGKEAITVIDQHETFREYRKKELRQKVQAGMTG